MDKKNFQSICKRAVLLIRFTCDGIEIIGTWEFTWTDFSSTPRPSHYWFFMQHPTCYNSTSFFHSLSVYQIKLEHVLHTKPIYSYNLTYSILRLCNFKQLYMYKACRGAPRINDSMYMCTCEYTYYENIKQNTIDFIFLCFILSLYKHKV